METNNNSALDLDDSYESNCSMNSNNNNGVVKQKGSSLFPYTNPYTQQQQQAPSANTAKTNDTDNDLPWSKTSRSNNNIRINSGTAGRGGGGGGGSRVAAAAAAGRDAPSPHSPDLHDSDVGHGKHHHHNRSAISTNTATTTTSSRNDIVNDSSSASSNNRTYNHHTHQHNNHHHPENRSSSNQNPYNNNNNNQRKMPPLSLTTTTTKTSASSTSSSTLALALSVSLDTLLDRLPTVNVAMSSPPDFILNQVFPKLQAAINVKHEESRLNKAATATAAQSSNGKSNSNNSHGWKLSTARNLVEWIWTLLDKIQFTTLSLQQQSDVAVKRKSNDQLQQQNRHGDGGTDINNNNNKAYSFCAWSKVFIAGLVLLQKTMELWMESQDNCLVYAILVHERVVLVDSKSSTRSKTESIILLEFLSNLTNTNIGSSCHVIDGHQSSQQIIMSASIACLATAWRCLDRLQWHSTTVSNTANSALDSSDNSITGCRPWWMQLQQSNDMGDDPALSAVLRRNVIAQPCSNDGSEDWSALLAKWALDTWLMEEQPAADDDHNFLHMDEQQQRQPPADQQFRPEELRLAAVTILDLLLRHGQADWLHTLRDDVYISLSKTLLAQAQRLMDPHMPYTCYTRLSLASLALLATLERKASIDLPHEYEKLPESTALVDFVTLASFHSVVRGGPSGNNNDINSRHANAPRWTQTDSFLLQPWTLPNLRQWNHTGRLFARRQRIQQQNHQQPLAPPPSPPQNQLVTDFELYTSEAWNQVMFVFQQQSLAQGNHVHASTGDSASLFRALLWLHTETRSIARSALSSLVQKMTAEQHKTQPTQLHGLSLNASPLLASLLQSIRPEINDSNQHGNEDNTCNLDAALLLHTLVEDRRTSATHDKLSRAIWNAIDESFVQDLLQTTLVCMTSGDRNRPALLALLDTLHAILLFHPQISWNIVESFSAQHLEALVQLVIPRNCRIDLNQQQQMFDADETFDMMESDENTPPANNLSRLDERSICVEIEEETKFHGIDDTVRIAAASILATFLATATRLLETNSHSCEKDRIDLLKSRMAETLTAFVADLQLSFCLPHQKSSIDSSRRRLRLLTTLAQSDCEEFVAGLIFATESRQRHSIQEIVQDACLSKKQLENARIREERLVKEKEALARQFKAQSAGFQKEKTIYQRTVSQNAKQLIHVHATERAKAEKQAHDMSKQLHDLERRAAQAENDAMVSKEAEANMKTSLESTAARLKEREAKLQMQERILHERQQEVERLTQELCSTKTSLSGAIQTKNEMREHIESQEETLVGMEKSQGELQESLESLFADMVGLAQLYEHQEDQLANSHQQGTALTAQLEQKLAKEKARNDELERRQEQMEYENEVLSKKYAHVREKLDEERSRQAEEASQQRRKKRTGPVSYINQLHNNTSVATTATSASGTSSSYATTGTSSRTSSKNRQNHHRHGKENASSSSSSRRESPSQHHRHRDRSGSRSRGSKTYRS